jgi:hypothetical protein
MMIPLTREELHKMIDRLSPDQQMEVARYLAAAGSGNGPYEPIRLGGLWRGIEISESDLEAARRERWGGFPRALDG